MKQPALAQRISLEPNPALLEHARKRAENVQNRIADRITAFAGSMAFVYIHILWFGSWIVFRVEKYPVRPADHDRLARGDLPIDVRDDQPEPGRRVASGGGRPAVADGPGRGQTERATARPLEPNPRADESGARLHERTIRHEIGGRGQVQRSCGVVVRELQPRHEQRAVHRECPHLLASDLFAIGGEGLAVDARTLVLGGPGIVRAHDVIGHAEDVEAGGSVEVDQLRERELAVAPSRVRRRLPSSKPRRSSTVRVCQRLCSPADRAIRFASTCNP
jgi:hypothetical protein